MLTELNVKFALQLDTCHFLNCSGQLAPNQTAKDCLSIVLVGSSQSTGLIDHLEPTNLRAEDCMVPGFHVTDSSVANMHGCRPCG